MNRRTLLSAIPALALAACQPGASTQTQLQTIAGLATAGVDAVAASVLSTPGLAATTAAKITAAQATVDAANAAIQKAPTTLPSNAQALALAIQVAKPLLLGAVQPGSDAAIGINAAFALVPTILAAAGVPVPPQTAAMAPGTVAMTADQATAFLHQWTGK